MLGSQTFFRKRSNYFDRVSVYLPKDDLPVFFNILFLHLGTSGLFSACHTENTAVSGAVSLSGATWAASLILEVTSRVWSPQREGIRELRAHQGGKFVGTGLW